MSKIKKVYIDVESRYIEITFENGEKHQLSDLEDQKPDETFSHNYKCDIFIDTE